MRDALLERDKVLAELLAERDMLRNSEERFRRLVENATVCINISDIYGRKPFIEECCPIPDSIFRKWTHLYSSSHVANQH